MSHRFPRKRDQALKWQHSLNLEHISVEHLMHKFVVCTKHFVDSDYRNALSKNLNYNALPQRRKDAENDDGPTDEQYADEYGLETGIEQLEAHPNGNDADDDHGVTAEEASTTAAGQQTYDRFFEEYITHDGTIENGSSVVDDALIMYDHCEEPCPMRTPERNNLQTEEAPSSSSNQQFTEPTSLEESKEHILFNTSSHQAPLLSGYNHLLQQHHDIHASHDEHLMDCSVGSHPTHDLDGLEQYLTIGDKCNGPKKNDAEDADDDAYVYVMEISNPDGSKHNGADLPVAFLLNDGCGDASDQMFSGSAPLEIPPSSSLVDENTIQPDRRDDDTTDVNAMLSVVASAQQSVPDPVLAPDQQLQHQQQQQQPHYIDDADDDEPYALRDTEEVRLYNEMSKRSLIQLLVAANVRIRDLEQRLGTIESAHSKVLGSLELFRSVLKR